MAAKVVHEVVSSEKRCKNYPPAATKSAKNLRTAFVCGCASPKFFQIARFKTTFESQIQSKMVITIELNPAAESKIMEPLLLLFKQHNIDFKIATPLRRTRKQPPTKPRPTGIASQLHGIVRLPENFDYKSVLEEGLLTKYQLHG